MGKIYPESKVELSPFIAMFYDEILDFFSFGIYDSFIHNVIKDCNFKPNQSIVDFGVGTGKNTFIILKYIGKNAKITGIDISDYMEKKFRKRFKEFKNIRFIKSRIDIPLDIKEKFDAVFISFVIHGFPNEIRNIIIKNAYNLLKRGGRLLILDFAEFSIKKMPIYYKIPFITLECKYAFDFIERDWKKILSEFGFGKFKEHFYFKNYIRLLEAKKIG